MPDEIRSPDQPPTTPPDSLADPLAIPSPIRDSWPTIEPSPKDGRQAEATIRQGSDPPAEQVHRTPKQHPPGYQLLRELGRGGMGVVYEARQEGLERIVAVKMILRGDQASTEELLRFRTEALAIAKLHHPNIVQVHAVGSLDGQPYFVLEYCGGGTLASRIPSSRGMDIRETAAIVAQLARGVEVAHCAGIIHRDLKPCNVLFTADGIPKITDFGLAKQLDDSHAKTITGFVMGTPAYMSPEQASKQSNVLGPTSDIFSLGVILYEALTGDRPFIAPTVWETLQRVCTRDPQPPRTIRPEVPVELEAIVLQCLEKDPARRYQTANDLADDLDRFLNNEPVRARREGRLERLARRLHQRRRLVVSLVAGLLLLPLLWVGLSDAGVGVPGSPFVQVRLDRHELSVFRKAPTESELLAIAVEHRAGLRERLEGLAAANDGWFFPDPQHNAPDPWTQMQGTVALCSSRESSADLYDKCLFRLGRVFDPKDPHTPFAPGLGWPGQDRQYSSEPIGWGLWALAKALAVPDLATGSPRATLNERLGQLQQTLENYQARDKGGRPTGGWTLFANQDDPSIGNAYITLLVCHGLLEMRRADLPWADDRDRARQLLRDSLAWLLSRFDGRGWSTPSTLTEQYNDGFSLQVFALLLDAEAAGYVELPDEVVREIPRTLAECSLLPADHQSPVALFRVTFRDHQGKPVLWAQRQMRSLWYPWAVSCVSRWLRRCERLGAAHDEVVRTRRILARLLQTVGPDVLARVNRGETFVTAELLIGLAAVE